MLTIPTIEIACDNCDKYQPAPLNKIRELWSTHDAIAQFADSGWIQFDTVDFCCLGCLEEYYEVDYKVESRG